MIWDLVSTFLTIPVYYRVVGFSVGGIIALLWLLFMIEPLLWSLFKVFMSSAKACNCKVFYFMLGNIAQFVSVLEPDNIFRGIEGLDFFDNVEDDRWGILKS